MVAHFGIPGDGADDFAIDAAADVPNVIANVAGGQDDGDAGDGGADAPDIGVSNAVLEDVALIAFVGDFFFFGRFDAAKDDVLTAKVFDLFLGFEAGAFANGQHGDDRTDAEDDAEDGQQGAEAMEPETPDAEADGALEAGEGEAAGPDGRWRGVAGHQKNPSFNNQSPEKFQAPDPNFL